MSAREFWGRRKLWFLWASNMRMFDLINSIPPEKLPQMDYSIQDTALLRSVRKAFDTPGITQDELNKMDGLAVGTGKRLWCNTCNKSEDYCCCEMEGNTPDYEEE